MNPDQHVAVAERLGLHTDLERCVGGDSRGGHALAAQVNAPLQIFEADPRDFLRLFEGVRTKGWLEVEFDASG